MDTHNKRVPRDHRAFMDVLYTYIISGRTAKRKFYQTINNLHVIYAICVAQVPNSFILKSFEYPSIVFAVPLKDYWLLIN
jgi:hypothetical protein